MGHRHDRRKQAKGKGQWLQPQIETGKIYIVIDRGVAQCIVAIGRSHQSVKSQVLWDCPAWWFCWHWLFRWIPFVRNRVIT